MAADKSNETTAPDPVAVARGELRARLLNEQEQYDCGFGEGFEAGYAAAHREMADWFALVARLVRQRAGHPSHAKRAAAEAEWVRPRLGDYMGRLGAAEYFGAAVTSTERRAA